MGPNGATLTALGRTRVLMWANVGQHRRGGRQFVRRDLVYDGSLELSASVPAHLAGFSLLCGVAFAPLAFLLAYTLRLSTIVSYPPLRNSFITDG